MRNLKIRQARPDENNFFADSWIKNMRANEPFKNMDFAILSKEYFPVIQTMLKEFDTFVATHEEEDNEILSFINFRLSDKFHMVNFIYTKKPYRKLGVARELIQKTILDNKHGQPIFFTHFSQK